MKWNSIRQGAARAVTWTVVALTISACPQNPKRIPITRNLTDGRLSKTTGTGAEANLDSFKTGDCLDLAGLVAELAKTKGRAFTLYTSSVDIGSSTAAAANSDFAPTVDDVARGKIFKSTAPRIETAYTANFNATAKGKITLSGLLAVVSQDACNSVTFSDPVSGSNQVFISQGDKLAGFLNLYNARTGEARRYSFNNDGKISVRTYTPATQVACDKTPLNTLKQELTIAWGETLKRDGLQLTRNYLGAVAQHVELPEDLRLPAPGTASGDEKAERDKLSQTLSLEYSQYLMFKNIVESVDFSGLVCK